MLKKILGKKLIFFLLLAIFFISGILFIANTNVNSNSFSLNTDKSEQIKTGWKYKIGDSIFNSDGQPLLTTKNGELDWKTFNIPGQPPNITKSNYIWLTVKLPSTKWKDPYLYFATYDQEIEFYMDQKLIFKYGNFSNPTIAKALGSPLCLVSLPENYENKEIYIRLRSKYLNTLGLVLGLKIGSKSTLLYNIIKEDFNKFVLSFLFIFIGLLTICLSFSRKVNFRALFALGFASIDIALWIIARTDLKLFFYNNPSFWFYVTHISNFLMPIGFLMYVEIIFANGKYKKILKAFWIFQSMFTAIILILDLMNLATLLNFITIYFVFLIIYIISVTLTIVKLLSKNNIEIKIFLSGIIVLSLFGINEFLYVYFRVLPWSMSLIHWGMFFFILSLVLILTKRFVHIYDNLKLYSKEIELKNETLNQMWKEIKFSTDTLAEWNENLELTIKQKTYAISNILNNAGQGFLTFGEDLIVDVEYSIECEKIFGKKIEYSKFTSLIYPDGEEKTFLEILLKKIINEENLYKNELYFHQLPKEISLNSKFISMNYKIIESEQIGEKSILMVIMTDITDKKVLEKKMEIESKILKMVVQAVTNHYTFSKLIQDYESFFKINIYDILDSDNSLQNIILNILREAFTFYETFRQLELIYVVNELNEFQTKLSEFNFNINEINMEMLRSFLNECNFSEWLKEDLITIKNFLGEKYFNHEFTLIIDNKKLNEIEDKIEAMLTHEQFEEVLPYFRELRNIPLKEISSPLHNLF